MKSIYFSCTVIWSFDDKYLVILIRMYILRSYKVLKCFPTKFKNVPSIWGLYFSKIENKYPYPNKNEIRINALKKIYKKL